MKPEDIVQANKIFYDENADKYESFQWYFRNQFMQNFWQREVDRIANLTKKKPFKVLDVGCGTGNLTNKFLKYNCSITAMDVSHKMLDLLHGGLSPNNVARVTLEVNSLDGFISKNSDLFDAVVECSVLHHLLDYELYLSKISRILQPGGYVLITREPVLKDELAKPTFFSFLADWFITKGQGWVLRSMERKGKHNKCKAPDHSLAALHYYQNGVSFKKLLKEAGNEFEVISYRTYNRRVVSLFSWIENTLFNKIKRERFQYTFFSAILKKKVSQCAS